MKFYSNGKLLITGEYLVLDGAKSLALPTKFGQNLEVNTIANSKESILYWQSFDESENVWFACEFKLPSLQITTFSDEETAKKLQQILKEAKKENKQFLIQKEAVKVKTMLTFPINWGLGTSSTLINNVASWAKINAFKLQFSVFGGSAYDIANAQNNTAILYQLKNKKPLIESIKFNPVFKDNLYFVYLNAKQNSRDAIAMYRKFTGDKTDLIAQISKITTQICTVKTIVAFEKLIQEHEQIISKIIGIKPIQERLFIDYFGQIKSLGAWGGDFILATGNGKTTAYFKKKGYDVVIPFTEMIL